jgi:PAS domain S-box-containing protein
MEKEEDKVFENRISQLEKNLSYFKALLETLPHPVFYKDRNGVYTGCNKAFERFCGQDRSRIIGKTVYDMGPAEIADKYHRMDEQLFSAGGTQTYEWKVQTRHEGVRDVIFDKAALIDENGNITGLIGIITDVTETKKSQDALKASEERFKKISRQANDAIVQMDNEGKIVYWNRAAEQIFGYAAKEALNKDLHTLLAPEKYQMEFERQFPLFKRSGTGKAVNTTVELEARRKDGSQFEIELSLASYLENEKWHAVGIVRDISGRKRIEREKEQLIQDLTTALDEIKTLKGIVPICASCKKIRDDRGFWNQLEVYIQEHSEAEFSHGICPDCVKKLYPKYHKD